MWESQIAALSDIAECWVTPLPPRDDLGTIADEILEGAPDRFALAGWSMGGYLCFEIYKRAPERVTHLGLFSTMAGCESKAMTARRHAIVSNIRNQGYMHAMRRLAPIYVHPRNRRGQIVESLVRQAYEVGKDPFCTLQTAIINRPEYLSTACQIRVPTLVLVGKHDTVTGLDVHLEMAEQIPNCDLVEIDDAAHMITMENSHATNDAMRRWLTLQPMELAA